MTDITRILTAIEQGDPHASAELLPLVYEELKKLAAQRMAAEKPGQTLQATALVHEAYLRLVDVDKAQHWDSRGTLLCVRRGSHAANFRQAGTPEKINKAGGRSNPCAL